jgi:transcriptional regulator with XRE-family HTH domain
MDEELQRTLGEVARAARERLGLTQAQVAQKVGLVPGVYGRIERGDMMPSVPSLRRISIVLGISSDALMGVSPSQVAATVDEAPTDGSGTAAHRPSASHVVAEAFEGAQQGSDRTCFLVRGLNQVEPSAYSA